MSHVHAPRLNLQNFYRESRRIPHRSRECVMTCAWRRHITHELQRRDRNQCTSFTRLFTHYAGLLDQTNQNSLRRSLSSIQALDPGQLACEVVELQRQLEQMEQQVQQQRDSVCEVQYLLQVALSSRATLQSQVNAMSDSNVSLKDKYDALLQRQAEAELHLRQEAEQQSRLLEQLIQSKREESQRVNNHNSRRSRAREVKLRSEVTTEGSEVMGESAAVVRGSSSSAPTLPQRTSSVWGQRSVSASFPRILSSLRGLFSKRRGRSLSLDVELRQPTTFSVSTGAPRRALHVWEPEDEAVHCVGFSRSGEVLATAGDERCLKLWNVGYGSLSVGATLFGFTQSVTCIDFDQTGFRVLASSSDNSALLWQLDNPSPKLILTGHRRKVCAARFCSAPPLVVTGSADGTLRLSDLQREACSGVLEAGSHCSDLVCFDSSVFSGHFNGQLRLWDLRSLSCVLELQVPDRVTSLDLSSDCRLLLGCCRDDALYLFDLRGRDYPHTCLTAEGFSCGSDINKAVLSPDRGLAAGGSSDGTVYVWDVSSGQVKARLTDQHSSSLVGVSWSVSGQYFVSVDKRRRAVLWSDI
ncbi:autophagy-related protein 16-1-like [Eucyclogobius newberryi]|uniref:autophagy-related protein 16-1-like n=1 Tax=Eucyclogobius newberryi TaxID=166745 RepID=UPI003B59822F